MTVLQKEGVKALSQLEIDADKDWQEKGITNIRQVAAGMAIGHLTQHDGTRLVTLEPGLDKKVLISRGPGNLVYWGDAVMYFWRIIPALLEEDHFFTITAPAVDKELELEPDTVTLWQLNVDDPATLQIFEAGEVEIDKHYSIVVPAALSSHDLEPASDAAYQLDVDDLPYRKYEGCLLETGPDYDIPTPTLSDFEPPLGTNMWELFIQDVEGAVAFKSPNYTDEIVAATNATPNDMTLLPTGAGIGDGYYFGASHKFTHLKILSSTAGVGNWTVTWQYWNGAAWVNIPAGDVEDDSAGFMRSGQRYVFITPPADWDLTQVPPAIGANLYWVRGILTAFVSMTTQPKGDRSWVNVP